MEEREQSTQYFMNDNAFRFNRGKEGDLAWRPRDYGEEDYRFDNSRDIGYGERYGFAAYGRAHYDPSANREFEDPRGSAPEPNRYAHTWSNDEPFNNREQDYRYHPDRNRSQLRDHRGRGPKNYTRSDDRIREEVSERLMRDSDVDPTDVEVLVTDGEVILKGTISDRPMKRRAEDLAEMVMGVKDVRNELRLSSLSMKSEATSRDTNSTSDGRQQSAARTEGTRGGGKQAKTVS
jgi:hypothetical protein